LEYKGRIFVTRGGLTGSMVFLKVDGSFEKVWWLSSVSDDCEMWLSELKNGLVKGFISQN
jgi:hypothetical protein